MLLVVLDCDAQIIMPDSLQTNYKDFDFEPYAWTNDFDNLFTDSEEYQLNKLIADFENETGIEIAILTIPKNIAPYDIDSLSLATARAWGIGKIDKANGILIAISDEKRKMRIENAREISRILDNHETKEIITNDFTPHFKTKNYYLGTDSGLRKMMEILRVRYK